MNPVFRAFRPAPLVIFAMAVALGAAYGCDRSSPSPDPARSNPEIRLVIPASNPAAAFVEVAGVSAADLAALRKGRMTDDAWRTLLGVFVKASGSRQGAPERERDDRPPMLGTYSVQADTIRFTPRFPLDPGRPYEVVFYPSNLPSVASGARPQAAPLVAGVSIPKREVAPSTDVAQVYPSGDVVPENLLRIYIHFSAPMSRRSGLDYIHLLDRDGREIKGPFLPLDTDLWNDDHTRYTVFFDPGRVKRDLPRMQMSRRSRRDNSTRWSSTAWPDCARAGVDDVPASLPRDGAESARSLGWNRRAGRDQLIGGRDVSRAARSRPAASRSASRRAANFSRETFGSRRRERGGRSCRGAMGGRDINRRLSILEPRRQQGGRRSGGWKAEEIALRPGQQRPVSK